MRSPAQRLERAAGPARALPAVCPWAPLLPSLGKSSHLSRWRMNPRKDPKCHFLSGPCVLGSSEGNEWRNLGMNTQALVFLICPIDMIISTPQAS